MAHNWETRSAIEIQFQILVMDDGLFSNVLAVTTLGLAWATTAYNTSQGPKRDK